MIASLGMYDFAETQGANDRLWALIRDGMRAVGLSAPQDLTRGAGAYWQAWQSPDLTLSQTCGFPYRTQLHNKVALIGTPDYGVAGCPPGHYCSIFLARAGDPREVLADFDGAAFVFNEGLSQSGWAAPQNHARSVGLTLRPTLRSGAHILSARAVSEGRADITAIDAVTWSMLQEWFPAVQSLKAVGATSPTPAVPYICASHTAAPRLFAIISTAIDILPAEDRKILRLRGFVAIPPEAYLAVLTPPTPDDLGMRD